MMRQITLFRKHIGRYKTSSYNYNCIKYDQYYNIIMKSDNKYTRCYHSNGYIKREHYRHDYMGRNTIYHLSGSIKEIITETKINSHRPKVTMSSYNLEGNLIS